MSDKAIIELLKVAACPANCTDGAYADNYGEPVQCQFCYEREQLIGDKEKAALSQQEAVTLDNAPIGTKAPSHTGGYWIRVERGWKWNTGATFGRPGGDWTGELIPPANPQPQKVESNGIDTSYIKEHAAQLYDISQKLASALNAGGRVELPKHWHKVPFRLEKLAEALADLSEEQKHEAINDLCSQLGIDRNPSYPDFNKWIKLHLKSPQNCGHYMIDAEELRQFIATGVLDK